MLGQVIVGLAQPFVLAAPTRYSDMWFTDHGRVAATAVMSLANPLGGALAQVVGPLWIDGGGSLSSMMLLIAVMVCPSSVVQWPC